MTLLNEPPYYRRWSHGDPVFPPIIAESAKIGPYSVICAGTVRHTRIGERTWLLSQVHVGHDAVIGDDCELTPGVVICGHVTVGDGVRFGVNACVKPFVTIGDGARIGMGAVVIGDVPADEVWVGSPAKEIRRAQQITSCSGESLTDSELDGWELFAEAVGMRA